MPIHFTGEELIELHQKLLDTAEEVFSRFGYRKTLLDDIVKRVGISKGSFYRFFSSKEELFLATIERLEVRFRDKLLEELDAFEGTPAETVEWFLGRNLAAISEHPLFGAAFSDEEMVALARKVGEDRFAEHTDIDDLFLIKLVERWQREGVIPASRDVHTTAMVMKAPYFAALHQNELRDKKDEAIAILFRAVAKEVTEEPA